MSVVLALDKNYEPHRWISYDDAIMLEAKNLVLNHIGENVIVYRGGINALTGKESVIETNTIIVVDGAPSNKRYKEPTLTNSALFQRDRYTCAYCGETFNLANLTRDHIHPVSKGGHDKWMNVVTACKPCNSLKGDILPGQHLPGDAWSPQGTRTMDPLYVPYVPCKAESMILRGRNIKADQMEFLVHRIKNQNSRILKDFMSGKLKAKG
jgi:5-methylcytosine-specific restriction endonuclease McrA